MARDLRHVLEAILAGVVVADRDCHIEDVNSAACRLLERSPEAVLGQPLARLVKPDHAIARLGQQVLASGVPTSQARQEIESRSGDTIEVDVAASPLFDDGGAVDGVVIVLRDRSAQRRLEHLESERERLAAFGRIAAGIAHEVKNPLGGIRGAAELLARRAENEKSKETADLIVRESIRIASLLDDFTVFSRGELLRLVPVNVHWVLDSVLDLIGHDPHAKDVEVERRFDPSIPEIDADSDRLTQVFLNLARNAFQAMDGGGRLTITTRMTLDHRISLTRGRPAPTLAVWIADSGPGMSEEERAQATTPFYTTRTGGTGLGLAVAEYWVAQHQGSLHIESEPGRGTTVRVTLPLRRNP